MTVVGNVNVTGVTTHPRYILTCGWGEEKGKERRGERKGGERRGGERRKTKMSIQGV